MNNIALRAVSDSSDGSVLVDFGDIDVTIPTTFNIRAGDTVQVQITNHKPCVIGVIGRGDQTQEQLDNATSEVDNLTGNIEAKDKELKLYAYKQELNINGAYIELIGDKAYANTPSGEDNEIATCGWVREQITNALRKD